MAVRVCLVAVKVKPGMYCSRCEQPVAAQKQTHKAQSIIGGALTGGALIKIGEWHCPNCGGPVEKCRGVSDAERQERERKATEDFAKGSEGAVDVIANVPRPVLKALAERRVAAGLTRRERRKAKKLLLDWWEIKGGEPELVGRRVQPQDAAKIAGLIEKLGGEVEVCPAASYEAEAQSGLAETSPEISPELP